MKKKKKAKRIPGENEFYDQDQQPIHIPSVATASGDQTNHANPPSSPTEDLPHDKQDQRLRNVASQCRSKRGNSERSKEERDSQRLFRKSNVTSKTDLKDKTSSKYGNALDPVKQIRRNSCPSVFTKRSDYSTGNVRGTGRQHLSLSTAARTRRTSRSSSVPPMLASSIRDFVSSQRKVSSDWSPYSYSASHHVRVHIPSLSISKQDLKDDRQLANHEKDGSISRKKWKSLSAARRAWHHEDWEPNCIELRESDDSPRLFRIDRAEENMEWENSMRSYREDQSHSKIQDKSAVWRTNNSCPQEVNGNSCDSPKRIQIDSIKNSPLREVVARVPCETMKTMTPTYDESSHSNLLPTGGVGKCGENLEWESLLESYRQARSHIGAPQQTSASNEPCSVQNTKSRQSHDSHYYHLYDSPQELADAIIRTPGTQADQQDYECRMHDGPIPDSKGVQVNFEEKDSPSVPELERMLRVTNYQNERIQDLSTLLSSNDMSQSYSQSLHGSYQRSALLRSNDVNHSRSLRGSYDEVHSGATNTSTRLQQLISGLDSLEETYTTLERAVKQQSEHTDRLAESITKQKFSEGSIHAPGVNASSGRLSPNQLAAVGPSKEGRSPFMVNTVTRVSPQHGYTDDNGHASLHQSDTRYARMLYHASSSLSPLKSRTAVDR